MIHHARLFFFSLFVTFILSSVNSSRFLPQTPFSFKLKSAEYKRLAKYCHIDDYSTWLERQQEFLIWFDLAKLLRLPLHEDKQFQQELRQYHLQYQCLRVVERLPLAVGPG